MLDDLILSETVVSAMRLAATERPAGQPLTTGRVLAALARVDMTNDWQRIWLETGDPQLLGLATAADPATGLQVTREPERWQGVPLSGSLANALTSLHRICRAYRLVPAPSGAMALALLADSSNGAARALTSSGGVSHSKLLELVQSDLLHTILNGVGELITAGPEHASVTPAPWPVTATAPRLPAGAPIAPPPRRGIPWRLAGWRVVASIALGLTVMAIFWNRQVEPSSAPLVIPPYPVPAIAQQMLTTADLPAIGKGGWLQMQNGPPTEGLFTGTGRSRADFRETFFVSAWQRTWTAADARAIFREAAYVARTHEVAVALMPIECAPASKTALPKATVAGYLQKSPTYAVACAAVLRGRTLLVFSVAAQGHAAQPVPWKIFNGVVPRQASRVVPTRTDLPLGTSLSTDTMTEFNSLAMFVIVGIPLVLGFITAVRDRSSWRRLRSRLSVAWLRLSRLADRESGTFGVDRIVGIREARLTALALLRVAVVVWSIRLSEHFHLGLPQTGGAIAATIAVILVIEWLVRRLTAPAVWRPAIFAGRRLVIGAISLILSAGIAGAGILLIVFGIVLVSTDTGIDGVSDFAVGRLGIGLPVFGGLLIVAALLPFTFARRLGMRALQNEAKKERSADEERHPVLMLRSFADDRRLLRARRVDRASIVERLCLRRFERFEEVAALALAVYAPVVALSDPREKLPPPLGAERRSFTNDDWMEEIRQLILAARLISVTVGRSPSLRWEIGQIRAAGALDRTIFLFPPTSKQEQRRRLTVLAHALGIDGALLNATRPHRDVLAVVFPAGRAVDGAPVIVTGTAPDDVGYETAIAAWALAVSGGLRTSPAEVRRLSADLSAYADSGAVASAAATLANPVRRAPVPTDPERLIYPLNKTPVYRPWSRRLTSKTVLPWLLSSLLIPAGVKLLGANDGPSQTINAAYAVTALAGDETSPSIYAVLGGHLIGQVDFGDPGASRLTKVSDYINSVVVRGSAAYYTSALAGHVGLVDLKSGRTVWVRSVPAGVQSPVEADGRVVVASPATGQLIELSAADGRIIASKTLPGTVYGVAAVGTTLFVTLARENAVAVVNADTLATVKTVPTPSGPRDIFATGRQVWVQCSLAHKLVPIGTPALPPVWLSVQDGWINGSAGLLAVQGMEWISVLTPNGWLTKTPIFETGPQALLAERDGSVVVGYDSGEIDLYKSSKS